MSKTKIFYLLFICIIVLSSCIRLWRLSEYPVGLHGDEASTGYNGLSLLTTLRDMNGNLLPLTINQWGDYSPAGYHYLTLPFIAVFGLSESAVRFPGAMIGIFSVIVLAAIVYRLTHLYSLSLITAFVSSISPWFIVASRSTMEGLVSVFVFLIGLYILLPARKDQNFKIASVIKGYFVMLSGILFYHSARVYVPIYIIFLTLFLVFSKRIDRNSKFLLIFVTLALCLLSFVLIATGDGTKRANQVSIFSSKETSSVLRLQYTEDRTQSVIITKLFHNKIFSYGLTFAKNYFEYFSGEFLFISGGLPKRYIVPYTGNFYLIDSIFFILGLTAIIVLIISKKKHVIFTILLGLLIGPIPAAITYEDTPNIRRSLFMLPFMIVIISFGILYITKIINHRIKIIIAGIISFAYIVSFIFFLHNYFYHAKMHEPFYRSVSSKQLALMLDSLSKRKLPVYLSLDGDNSQLFYLYYWKIPPVEYQKFGYKSFTLMDTLLNINFIANPCPLTKKTIIQTQAIYVNRFSCDEVINSAIYKKTLINRPDGSLDYTLYEVKPLSQ